jgi:hypothetical protein
MTTAKAMYNAEALVKMLGRRERSRERERERKQMLASVSPGV